MITLIVWSKDRAAQLDLLLRSINKHCPNVFDIHLVLAWSHENYHDGYSRLVTKLDVPAVTIHDEHDNIGQAILTRDIIKSANEFVGFSTDDTVIYRPCNRYDDIVKWLSKPQICTFSLRYGFNTTLQDFHRNLRQPPLNQYHQEGDILWWPHALYHPNYNYGYPFGLDMHVYKTELIERHISTFSFANSNQLESGLFKCKSSSPPYTASFDESVAVNIPANSISGVTRAGEKYSWSLEEVNDAYLDGRRISLENIEKTKVIGSHQEIPLIWE